MDRQPTAAAAFATGLLPQPPKLRLWGKKGGEEGLDTAKRFLHITANALVLEVEGTDEVSEHRACDSGYSWYAHTRARTTRLK